MNRAFRPGTASINCHPAEYGKEDFRKLSNRVFQGFQKIGCYFCFDVFYFVPAWSGIPVLPGTVPGPRVTGGLAVQDRNLSL